MVRRAVLMLLVSAIALVGSACSTVEGREAVEILEQATTAQESVESMTFGMRVWGEAEGQTFTLKVDGGGYVRGERAGDLFMTGSIEGPGVPAVGFQFVTERGRSYAEFGGVWQELPVQDLGEAESAELEAQLADFDFTRFVKDVQVTDGTTFLGEPATKIVGVIDTSGLMDGLFDQLGGFSQLGVNPLAAGFSGDQAPKIGDTRAVLYVSDVTHLVRAALLTMSLEAAGETLEVHVDIAVRSVNEPVEIPDPAV